MPNDKADPALVMIVAILMVLVTVKYIGGQSIDPRPHQPDQTSALSSAPPS